MITTQKYRRTMADRYGDDMQFKKMMERMKRESTPANIRTSNIKKKFIKVPVGSTPKELDKNNWEYWEKRRTSMVSMLVEVTDDDNGNDDNNDNCKQPSTGK